MAPFLRKVRTGSGATAVQIVEKSGRQNKVLEHLGSANTPAELAALMRVGREKIHEGQVELDLGPEVSQGDRVSAIGARRSRWLIEAVTAAWQELGFDVVDDEAFFQLVLARLVEPTSMSDAGRVIAELGLKPVHRNTFANAAKRCGARDYRELIATACFQRAMTGGDLSLVLCDVTTLYFEAEEEDELRKIGYSKERRIDPQIVVGLLVDRAGFPLEIGCFEGAVAETKTLVPVIRRFQERHRLADMVVVADAGMLSAKNLAELEEASLRFIVGSRQTKAPGDLAERFQSRDRGFADGETIDTQTPRQGRSKRSGAGAWDPGEHPSAWRAVWAYSEKRAARDAKALAAQERRARAVISGEKAVKSTRFVKTTAAGRKLDERSLERARSLLGLKGYVTNIPASLMSAEEVVSSYHDLWHVEQSFRMSKTDLRARPMFVRTQDAIEAHLTVVFTALALARHLEARTGVTIKKLVRTLRPLQEIEIEISGHKHVAADPLTEPAREFLGKLGILDL